MVPDAEGIGGGVHGLNRAEGQRNINAAEKQAREDVKMIRRQKFYPDVGYIDLLI